ncbi:hypothetical protein KC19_8G103700 [Ceratodon purpureus]|uniref:Uncharacterized protein n=1 Tax=Ceratodon purpureus TaxID=3225 RepID=A0A8T0GZR0_CERPU|nr:hypothetical protein KC19_8G103700 [Ceratodon purpureus]
MTSLSAPVPPLMFQSVSPPDTHCARIPSSWIVRAVRAPAPAPARTHAHTFSGTHVCLPRLLPSPAPALAMFTLHRSPLPHLQCSPSIDRIPTSPRFARSTLPCGMFTSRDYFFTCGRFGDPGECDDRASNNGVLEYLMY